MATFDFSTIGVDKIIVRFNCKQCKETLTSEPIKLPYPDYMAETSSNSQVNVDDYLICKKCSAEYNIDVFVSFSGGDGFIAELPDYYDIDIEEIDDPYYTEEVEAAIANSDSYETYKYEIQKMNYLLDLELDNEELKRSLIRVIFTGCITIMEVYLCDTFLNHVLFSKKNLNQFLKTSNNKIRLSSIIEWSDSKAIDIVKNLIITQIYHRLKEVSTLYKKTLNIQFPDFSAIEKSITITHHIIHRNGKDSEGNEIILDTTQVKKVIQELGAFIENIENQIIKLKSSF